MDFKQTSVSGVQPPTTPKTKTSNVGVAVSSTSTFFGQPIVIKALSDAAMYKTKPVTFFSNWNDGTTSTLISLGQNTFQDPTTAPLFIATMQTGTHDVYVTWPGENKFAPFSTADKPTTITVSPGLILNGTFTLTASTASGTLIQDEGGVTFTADIISDLAIPGTILFIENHQQLDNVPITSSLYGLSIKNSASFSLSTMTAGVHVIDAVWSGGYINGQYYQGKVATIVYTVLTGRPQGPTTAPVIDQTTKIVGEGNVTVSFDFSSTGEPAQGNVTFYANTLSDSGIVGTVPVVNNHVSLTFTNTNVTGTNYIGIFYDGNYPNHPRFTPYGPVLYNDPWINLDANTATMSLELTPHTVSKYFGTDHFVATLNTSTAISGNIKFYQDGYYLGQSSIGQNNQATFLHREFNTGTHIVEARYAGSTNAPKWHAVNATGTYTVVEVAPYEGVFTLTSDNYSPSILNTLTLTVNASLGSTLTGYMTYFEEKKIPQYTNTGTTTTYSLSVINKNTIIASGAGWSRNGGGFQSNPWIQITNISNYNVGQQLTVYVNASLNHNKFIMSATYIIESIDRTSNVIKFKSISNTQNSYYNLLGVLMPVGQLDPTVDPYYAYPNQGIQYRAPFLSGATVGQDQYDIIAMMDTSYPIVSYFPFPRASNDYYQFYPLESNFLTVDTVTPQFITVATTSTTGTINSYYVVTATIGSSFFNSSTQTKLTIDPTYFIAPQTGEHNIYAVWSGGYVDNAYAYGIASNTVTVTTSVPDLALTMHAASAGAIDNPSDPTFFLPARLQTVVSASNPLPGTVTFYKDGTYIGSTATTGQTNSITIPEGTIVPGSHTFTATWTSTNITPIASNGITKTISGKVNLYMTAAMDGLASNYYYYNYDRTANTSTTATFSLASMVIDNAPTGTFTLYNGSSTVATYTAGWSGYTSGGLSGNLHWNPQTANMLDQGNKTLSLVYSGDNHYNTTSTSFTFAGITKVPAITPTLTVNTTNTFANPVTFTVQTGAARPVNPVQLRDGSTVIASGNIDSTGTVIFSGITLTSGTHIISAIVSGDDVLANTATVSLSVVKEDPQPNLPAYAGSHNYITDYIPGNPSPNIDAFTFLLDPLHRIDSDSLPNKNITVNIYYRDYNTWFHTKGPLFRTVNKTVGDFSNPAGLKEYYYNGGNLLTRTISDKYVIDLRDYPEFNQNYYPGSGLQGPVIINGVGHSIHGFFYDIIYTGGGIVPAFTASGFAGPDGGTNPVVLTPRRAIPLDQTDYYVGNQGPKKY